MRYTKKTTNLSFNEIVYESLKQIKNSRVLVAFSGGKDSLALLHFIVRHKDELALDVHACHINHGVRDEADSDEAFCKQFSIENDVKFTSISIKDDIKSATGDSFEAVARKYRYNALQTVAHTQKIDYILTAHTYSDQLESFVIDMFTGASVYTMQGIALKNNNIFRAMLGVTTEQVEDYIAQHNLTPAYDKTNDDTKYVRNNIRKNVLPILAEHGGSAFENSVMRIQAESQRLQEYMLEKIAGVVDVNHSDYALIDRRIFLAMHALEQEFLLGNLFADKFRFTKQNIYEALALVNDSTSKRIDMPSGFCFENSYNSIRLFKKCLVEPIFVEKQTGIGRIEICDVKISFTNDKLLAKLNVRYRKTGDMFMGKKLKDLFINKKIDLFLRDRAIVVEQDDKIIWVEYISTDNDIIINREER